MKLLPPSSYFLPSHKEFSGLNRCSAAFLGYLKQLDWDYPTWNLSFAYLIIPPFHCSGFRYQASQLIVKNLCMLKKPPTTISHLANRRYYLGRVQEQPGSCTMPWGCWIRDVRVYIPDCSCSSAYEPVVHSLVSSPLDLLMLPVFTTPHCNTVEKIVSCFLKKYFLPFFLMSFPINVIEHPWSL